MYRQKQNTERNYLIVKRISWTWKKVTNLINIENLSTEESTLVCKKIWNDVL